MNRVIIYIILATITVASYGKASACSSTYDVSNDNATKHQYITTIDCSANQKCKDAVKQFTGVADNTTNKLASIIGFNRKEFIFDYHVSFNDN